MGYFNFYILKEFYKKNKKFIHKFIVFIFIFFIVSILKSKCFAFDYNSNHYIEYYDTVRNGTIRICSDRNFMIVPNYSNPQSLNAYDLFNGSLTEVSVFRNGVDLYNGSTVTSQFLTNNSFYGGTPQITAYKGYYVVCTYDTTLHSFYEYSEHFSPFIFDDATIPSWNFNNFRIAISPTIMPFPHSDRWNFTLIININGTNYTYNINQYLEQINFTNGSSYNFNYGRLRVPRYTLLQDAVLKKNDTLHFYLKTDYTFQGQTITDTYDLGTYNLTFENDTNTVVNGMSSINNNINNVNNNLQENTQAVEHLEETISDPTVSDDSISLPTIDVNNPTQVGIDQVFTQFYNAFCTGISGDIVFPIPNTNKNITLPGNFLYNMLHSNGGDVIINIITAFWWYTIGSWVVKDIWDKIFKIQEGEVENIQTSNIKADML